MESHRPQELNEPQKRHLLAHFQYADKLLSEIESILTAAHSRSAFPKFRPDVTPTQAGVVADSIARLRARMLRALHGLGVDSPAPHLGAVHSIRVTLRFVDIAFEECRPRRMKGCGALPRDRQVQLEEIVNELQGLVAQLDASLAQEPAQDAGARPESGFH